MTAELELDDFMDGFYRGANGLPLRGPRTEFRWHGWKLGRQHRETRKDGQAA